MTWPHKGHFDMYQSRTRFRLPLTLPLPGPAAPPAGSATETDIASQEI
ncbi:hypothetical protein VXL81_08735 [Phaeobacter sp. JH204B]